MKCSGDSFSYCANPTGAKTDWCPTQLNADGSYTSDLPFSWCEAEVGTQENNDNNEATLFITTCRCSRRARRPRRATRWRAPALLTGSTGARTTASVQTPTTGASSGAPRRRMRWVAEFYFISKFKKKLYFSKADLVFKPATK